MRAVSLGEKQLVILQKRVARLSEAALERFVLRARRAARLRGSVNVLVTGSSALRALNARFRDTPAATDVLSFPAPAIVSNRKPFAGDLAISADIALANSKQLGHSPADEIKILALHGILHLAGYDHERDNGEMARKELALRRSLRLPLGLIERCQPPAESPSRPRKSLRLQGPGRRP